MAELEFQSMMVSTIREILELMGVHDATVDVFSDKEGAREALIFSITVDRSESKILIGQHGVALFSLQHLLHMIARRKSNVSIDFSVDVNRYWKEKREHLRRDAEDAARECISTGRPVSLRAMLPYERKIVHATLAENERVETGSVGRGEERKVVVKPRAVFS